MELYLLITFLLKKRTMKKSLLLLLTVTIYVPTLAQSKVVTNIINLKTNKGICRACLFNNPSSFKGEDGKPYVCASVSIKNKEAKAVFENVPKGNYALFVFHDENSNNKMDKNFLGIPKEGYGASKNKLPFAAAPTFNDNMFSVENKTTTELFIKIKNL